MASNPLRHTPEKIEAMARALVLATDQDPDTLIYESGMNGHTPLLAQGPRNTVMVAPRDVDVRPLWWKFQAMAIAALDHAEKVERAP